jgi:hypothetical protein
MGDAMNEEKPADTDRLERMLRRWGAEEAAHREGPAAPPAALLRASRPPAPILRWLPVAAGFILFAIGAGLFVATLTSDTGRPAVVKSDDATVKLLQKDLEQTRTELASAHAAVDVLKGDARKSFATDTTKDVFAGDKTPGVTAAEAEVETLKKALAEKEAFLDLLVTNTPATGSAAADYTAVASAGTPADHGTEAAPASTPRPAPAGTTTVATASVNAKSAYFSAGAAGSLPAGVSPTTIASKTAVPSRGAGGSAPTPTPPTAAEAPPAAATTATPAERDAQVALLKNQMEALQSAMTASTEKLRKAEESSVAAREEAARKIKALEGEQAQALALFQRVTAAARLKPGEALRTLQATVRDAQLIRRGTALRDTVPSEAVRRLFDTQEALLTQLDLLDPTNAGELNAFIERVRSTDVGAQITEALKTIDGDPAVRAWLIESQLLLSGVQRAG